MADAVTNFFETVSTVITTDHTADAVIGAGVAVLADFAHDIAAFLAIGICPVGTVKTTAPVFFTTIWPVVTAPFSQIAEISCTRLTVVTEVIIGNVIA